MGPRLFLTLAVALVLVAVPSGASAPVRVTVVDLGTHGGLFSEAKAINNSGQVVGTSETLPGLSPRHAFVWEDGVMTDLGTLGGAWSEAVAINERGQVAGRGETRTDDVHALLWDHGVVNGSGVGMFVVRCNFPAVLRHNQRNGVVGVFLTA